MDRPQLPQGCRLLCLPHVADERGALAFAQGGEHVPFAIARTFWIFDVPPGQTRGGHAHCECVEAVFAVSGAFTMVVDDGKRRSELRLAGPAEGILIPAGLWCELRDFEPGTVVAVLASHAYNPDGYIHDYGAYLTYKGVSHS